MLLVCMAIECKVNFLVMRLVIVHGSCSARIGNVP